MPEGLVWPPRKEDLERLYLVENLSAAKIAKAYGLKYKSPKVGESTVLYQLKKNGIMRRDPAEHIRKVTEAMVDEWVRRYQTGESLKQIAGDKVGPVTVWNHLKARSVVLRDKVEAQIQAVTKYERRPFQGDDVERAYLMGLRYGDLNAVRHGRAIRVRVSTTHPAMASLFKSLFSPYGHVNCYPRNASLTESEWTLEVDLESSFDFLLSKTALSEIDQLPSKVFRAFLAGFFDAEGSIFLHAKAFGSTPEIQIRNMDIALLRLIARKLRKSGVAVKLSYFEQDPERFTTPVSGGIWSLAVWRFGSVKTLIASLPLRHQEKIAKRGIALRFQSPISNPNNSKLIGEWEEVNLGIERARQAFIREARTAMLERR
ncbi:MAG: hypothetical protein KGI38_06375 [Thaumarchaeota archaeon]|nr:hypothetical protein [Nitrososphaerota archaeon]